MTTHPANDMEPTVGRQRWLSILARSPSAAVAEGWSRAVADGAPDESAFIVLREPQVGLVMLQGRAGGTGAPFNLGEAPVTRCSVQAPAGTIGHAWVLGRDVRKAALVARLDSLLQDPRHAERLERTVIQPLESALAASANEAARKTATSRVEFFTLVRGDNPE